MASVLLKCFLKLIVLLRMRMAAMQSYINRWLARITLII